MAEMTFQQKTKTMTKLIDNGIISERDLQNLNFDSVLKTTSSILIFREVNGMNSEGYEIIPMKPEEVLYSYRNSQQISNQTGLVGYIRADMGTNGNQFWVTWNCFRNDLNTPEFSNELSELLHSLRQDGKYLSDRDTLMRFCLDSKNALPYETGRDFGVRVNTGDHAYLMRLNPHKGEYNLYCYCYRKDWLDSHIRQAKRGIRFIDPHYRERFRIADGDEIIISGEPNAYTVRDVPARYVCRYIDDSHFEYGPNLRHICEFAETLERRNGTCRPRLLVKNAAVPERLYPRKPMFTSNPRTRSAL